MAIDFPNSPNTNDIHTDGGKTWIWDGTTWKIYSSSTSGIGLTNLSVTTGSVGTAALSYNNTTGVFTYTPPDLSGYITSQYTLPTASTTVLGGVKIDGSTITINGSGVISGASTYSLPTASTTILGGVKIDGTTITINNGVISGASSVPTSITVANESTDVECFPLFTTTAIGDLAPKTVTSLKLNSSSGQLEAGSFKKTGGTSSEFLKADGSIDSTTYLSSNPSYALNDLSNVDATTNLANGKILKYDLSTTSWIVADDGGGSGSGGGNVAVGSVMIWSGAIVNIPTGWQLCDGTNGSPDLRDKFVVGAGSTYAVDDTGGSKDAVVVEHKHTTSVDNHLLFDGSGSQNISYGGAGGYPAQTFTMNNEGVSGTDKNLPPYYSLCYIYCTATGSNQTFIGLDDTPISHSNGKWLQSNGSSLVWADAPSGGFSGDYNDLTNKPTIPAAQVQSDWNATGTLGEILNKPTLFSGSYNDLSDKPTIPAAQIQSDWNQSTTSSLDFIKNKPTIPAAQIQSDWNQSNNGSLDFIKNKPTIPAAQVNSDWNATSGVEQISNKPTLFSGSYTDLSNKPTIPSAYANSDVDSHLNTSTASSGQILSWTGSDYDWVADAGFSGNYNDLSNKPTLFSGSYDDLSNRPTLFSGSYDDLSNRPTTGVIRQVLSSSTDSTQYYRYYQGPIDVGLEITINCADANNKILIEYTLYGAATTDSNLGSGVRPFGSRLLRNGSQIAGGTGGSSGNESAYTDTQHDGLSCHSFSYADTPGAGNHTYKVQIRHHLSGSYSNYLVLNRSRDGNYRTVSTITCSEIII